MAVQPRRRKPAEPPPVSNEDICHRINTMTEKIELLGENIDRAIDAVLDVIGTEGEDQYGKPTGTGLTGRVMRVEHSMKDRFNLYDRWVWGLTCIATTLGIALSWTWWLIKDEVESIFK